VTTAELKESLGVQPPAESITWFNGMIYGEPGVGKTTLLGTAQDHPLTSPLLIIDIDGGVSALRRRRDIDVIQVRTVKQLADAYKLLYNAIPSNPKDKFPWGTIGVDTLSELQQLDLVEVMTAFSRINDKIDKDVPDQRGYGKSGTHMRSIVRQFRDLPCNTIFNCHSQSERDNSMKLITYPKLVGKLRTDIPGFLDIVGYYRTESDGNGGVDRLLQFMKTDTTNCKDRTGAFDPIEMNPTIPSLWDKLQLSNK